ncbi:hypothetical protein PF010_g5853 [Phytophthora fragariae]|uniref:HTH psq-type domain-containing protein n=2 Tax=Phytophthora fragariae TaxID=53985 RepID=A0A6A3ZZS3_9STRA|nr:hypothetical protein PF010_g5853 [Phytophthora fragariae]KAE9244841.1 hypothetical protein PF002_g7555 [Phytophthora fragariae]
MQQQPMGEFMVLHAETNATSGIPARHGAPQHHQENGEKQAALGREYGVTRTTICHMKKNHRDGIITRYDLLVKQAQEIDRAENVSEQPDEEGTVRELLPAATDDDIARL